MSKLDSKIALVLDAVVDELFETKAIFVSDC